MSCACGTGMWEALCHSHRHHMTTGRLRNKGRERVKTFNDLYPRSKEQIQFLRLKNY